MGKIFPYISNLKEKPHLISATVALIEKSFHYQAPFSFKEDFASLIHTDNLQNCFIMLGENENVIAHIGVKEKNILLGNTRHPIAMLGGIAVDETHRGEGHFQTLMSDVLAEKRSDVACFILWSDQESLYKKFGFHLCGDQFEFSKTTSPEEFEKIKLRDLNDEDKNQLNLLYQSSFAKNFSSLERKASDWNILASVVSADLYIRRENGKIVAYFFMNKGQDLGGIIYEYGSLEKFETLFPKLQAYGKVWSPYPYIETDNSQYQFLLAPADKNLLSELICAYTTNLITLREINLIKNEAYFDFAEETLSLEIEDFLRGMFGPGSFEELGAELKPLFISGLDSI